ncbi:MAG: hypothetical protein PHF46_03475, partial [Candidatus Gracilibacteria bacterium]|nr:hypothetical protein [Candidatus Gracilibacteria bacterium]
MLNFLGSKIYLSLISGVHGTTTKITQTGASLVTKTTQTATGVGFFESAKLLGFEILKWLIYIALFFIALKILRIISEIWTARNFVYLKITLPRADSKLDKEKETKKDFKEKIGIMTIFFKSIHKIGDTSLLETIFFFVFKHSRISLEIVYNEGQVSFYIITLKKYFELITQQVTSNYPDAEVSVIEKKDYFDIKPRGYTFKAASFHKSQADFFPIKTYKYFEDDPLNTFSNNFGALDKTDRAVFQLVIKPLKGSWNTKAKKSARLVSKGEYKSNKISKFINVLKVLSPVSWFMYRFVKNEEDPSDLFSNKAPGASSGDSYKIFNQAEQETQKAVGECAGQPRFMTSIRILVSSKTKKNAWIGLNNVITSTNIFTDEYNNKLDNPQILEDLFSFIITPLRYFAYKLKLTGIIQNESAFSTDELVSMYHFPDINYNKSPIIDWLSYKMLATPYDLKIPRDPMILSDYKRDSKGNIYTEDGDLLKVDKNGNALRDKEKNFISKSGSIIKVIAEGEGRGKPIDKNKIPVQENKQRQLGGFPLYKDSVLL